MKTVRAALRRQIHHSAKHSSVLGVAVMRLDLELVNRVLDRQVGIGRDSEIAIDDAIEKILSGSIHLAVTYKVSINGIDKNFWQVKIRDVFYRKIIS